MIKHVSVNQMWTEVDHGKISLCMVNYDRPWLSITNIFYQAALNPNSNPNPNPSPNSYPSMIDCDQT